MAGTLTSKQVVPLTDDERAELQTHATRWDLTVGLLTRALVLHSLQLINTAGVERQIEQERSETKRRTSEGAQVAARARWGQDKAGVK